MYRISVMTKGGAWRHHLFSEWEHIVEAELKSLFFHRREAIVFELMGTGKTDKMVGRCWKDNTQKRGKKWNWYLEVDLGNPSGVVRTSGKK